MCFLIDSKVCKKNVCSLEYKTVQEGMRGYWSAFWFFFASKLFKQFFFSLEFGISILPLKGDFSIYCVNIFRRVRFWVSICRAMHFTQLLRQIANVLRSLYIVLNCITFSVCLTSSNTLSCCRCCDAQ